MKTKPSSSTIIGGNHKGTRQQNDFYPTHPDCTHALLKLELQHIRKKKVLEPCCGDGAISKILTGLGIETVSRDLIDRGFGDVGEDFLTSTDNGGCDALITNPPYALAEKFIRHGFEVMGVKYMAMLVKSQFWHAKSRQQLFIDHPPSTIYFMSWRPDFLGLGAPTMDFIWTVWRDDHVGPTTYVPMHKSAQYDLEAV